ncbi:MAG: sugar phosphate isomerase/epimerase family protein, partial [Capsulimonadaceae bacterium]
MNIGYQTIIYRGEIDDLARVLDIIQAAGFKGVEFAQKPSCLREMIANKPTPVKLDRLRQMLQERDLTFLGLAGGKLAERMDFCDGKDGSAPFHPLYLYVDDCSISDLIKAATRRYRLALHSHVYMRNHLLNDARRLLTQLDQPAELLDAIKDRDTRSIFGSLYWMPDTAHLSIVGENIVDALDLVAPERILAVHIKDWDAAYGRSYHRYAKGFTELGEGDVDLAGFIKKLQKNKFNGWLVVEQDYAKADTRTSILKCVRWLMNHSIPIDPKEDTLLVGLDEPQDSTSAGIPFTSTIGDNDLADLNKRLNLALLSVFDGVGKDPQKSYKIIIRALQAITDCRLSAIWTYSPERDELCLLEQSEEGELPPTRKVRSSSVEPGICTIDVPLLSEHDHPRNRLFDLHAEARRVKADQIVRIAVPNAYNNCHVRLYVTLFVNSDNPAKIAWSKLPDNVLLYLMSHIAACADSSLEEKCSYEAGKVSILAGRFKTLNTFLHGLNLQMRKALSCGDVTIFLINPAGDLEETPRPLPSSADSRIAPEIHKEDSNSQEASVLRLREAFLRNKESSLLIVPMFDSDGRPLAVIRCRNKQVAGQSVPDGRECELRAVVPGAFSEDDAAVLDAIAHAAASHMQVLRNDVMRSRAVRNLTHELRQTLTPTIALLSLLGREPELDSARHQFR